MLTGLKVVPAASYARQGSLPNLKDRNVHASSGFVTTQICFDQHVCVLTALRESHIRLKSTNISSETNEWVNGVHIQTESCQCLCCFQGLTCCSVA